MREYHTPKAMKRVGDLFEKYRKNLKAPQASVEKVCVEVMVEVTGFKLEQSQIMYNVSTRTISMQVPSILKNELQFHHEAILSQLAARLGESGCPKRII